MNDAWLNVFEMMMIQENYHRFEFEHHMWRYFYYTMMFVDLTNHDKYNEIYSISNNLEEDIVEINA
jgi:hypothetical protein